MSVRPTLIASVQRALHLLDAIGAADRPLPAKALARATGEALPTTYHLLRTLVHEGYLVRVEGGYTLGSRVMALSGRIRPATLAERVHPALRDLLESLHAAAYLAIYEDGEVRLVDVVDSPSAPRVDLWVDLHVAGHATALGKAVLAGLDDDARREYLSRHDLVDLTPYTLTDRRVLLRRLDERGLTLDRQEYSLGIACVATPVRVADTVGAVAVSVPTTRLPYVLEHADELRATADRLALDLAH